MRLGVSQGSVIAPLLFLVFVNDHQDVIEELTLFHEDDLNKVTSWAQIICYQKSPLTEKDS